MSKLFLISPGDNLKGSLFSTSRKVNFIWFATYTIMGQNEWGCGVSMGTHALHKHQPKEIGRMGAKLLLWIFEDFSLKFSTSMVRKLTNFNYSRHLNDVNVKITTGKIIIHQK